MIKSNEAVIRSWIDGKPDEGKTIKTNGKDLFSSGLKIGFTEVERIDKRMAIARKVVYSYKEEFYVSDSITRHVELALKILENGKGVRPPEIKRVKQWEKK